MGLYVNSFQLGFLNFVSAVKVNNDWIITAKNDSIGCEYSFYYGSNEYSDNLVSYFTSDTYMIVYGTLKENKSKNIILRAKQILSDTIKDAKIPNLYINTFQLYPLKFVSIDDLYNTNNKIIVGHCDELSMNYSFYYGISDFNINKVSNLEVGKNMIVYGTIKKNKNNEVILRAKQIIGE